MRLAFRVEGLGTVASGEVGGLTAGGAGGAESESRFIIDIGFVERGGKGGWAAASMLPECECVPLLRGGSW